MALPTLDCRPLKAYLAMLLLMLPLCLHRLTWSAETVAETIHEDKRNVTSAGPQQGEDDEFERRRDKGGVEEETSAVQNEWQEHKTNDTLEVANDTVKALAMEPQSQTPPNQSTIEENEYEYANKTTTTNTTVATSTNSSRTIVIHVGPGKTGTSFFQQSFSCSPNATTANLYSLDNLVYLGTCPFFCSKNDKSLILHNSKQIYDNPAFYEQLNKAEQQGKNAFVVYEYISSTWSSRMAHKFSQNLKKRGWEIKIVFAYRRFFEWVFSLYNQRAKPLFRRGWARRGVRSNMLYKYVPAFEYTEAASILRRSNHTKEHEFAQRYRMMVGAFGKDHVTILDIHQNHSASSSSSLGDPLLEHFVCELLPNATHTCSALRNGVLNLENGANPSISLEYDALAFHAQLKGLYTGELKRGAVATATKNHALAIEPQDNQSVAKPIELPYVCWESKKAESLLSLSLEAERKFFLEAGLPVPSADVHKVAFEAFLQEKKLCKVNVELALQDPQWIEFFKNLE